MLRLLTLDKHRFTIFKWQTMPQSGRKLTDRFLRDFTGPAIRCHTLNPQLWVPQLRGAGAHANTHFHPHAPTSLQHRQIFHLGHQTCKALSTWKKKNLQSIRNRGYHLPLCTDQQVPASGIAQSRGGCWLWEACGSHKCGKH